MWVLRDTTLQKKKKSASEQIIMAHDYSFLLWVNGRKASLDSCLLKHRMVAILKGRDHAPKMVLNSPSVKLHTLGHLKGLLEKEGAAVPTPGGKAEELLSC